MRVAANGGTPELLAAAQEGEVLTAPEILPGGRSFMYTAGKGGTGFARWDTAQVIVQTIGSPKRTVIIDGGSEAHYIETGHLVYAVGSALFAIPFDLQRLRVAGRATPVVEGVRRAANGQTSAANFDVSRTGTLLYVPAPAGQVALRHDLAFVTQSGAVDPLKLPPGPYLFPRVSPDGRTLAVTADDGDASDIWIRGMSASSSPMSRLTFGGRNKFPVWASDGTRIAFQSDRDGDRGIFWQRVDAPGTAAERLTRADKDESHIPTGWSPNDGVLLFTITKGTNSALWTFSRAENKIAPFDGVRGSDEQPNAVFSPDGKWVAYTSHEISGRVPQIVVQPFPATSTTIQVGPGVNPMWSRDGKTLFFSGVAAALQNFSGAPVSTERGFAVTGLPVSWPRPGAILIPNGARNYDITPDGQRFLIVIDAPDPSGTASAGLRLEFALNWTEELRQRVPTR
jgi:dipeptidyl aminopeptidase/acylaminoacyl peptidase